MGLGIRPGRVAGRDPDGRPTILFVAIQNIDDRKRAEEELANKSDATGRSTGFCRRSHSDASRTTTGPPCIAPRASSRSPAITAEDFLSGRVHYAELMLPDDLELTRRQAKIAITSGGSTRRSIAFDIAMALSAGSGTE